MPLDLRALSRVRSSAVLKFIVDQADRCVPGPLEQTHCETVALSCMHVHCGSLSVVSVRGSGDGS